MKQEKGDVVTIKRILHYQNPVTGIFFPPRANLLNAVRKIASARFSKSCSCWYVPLDTPVSLIASVFENLAHIIIEHASNHDDRLSRDKEVVCPSEYIQLLQHKRYSESTIRNYVVQFELYLKFFAPRAVDTLTEADIKKYMDYLVVKRKVSPSTQNQAINAIKFYYEKVKGGETKYYTYERPIKESKLPTVLSEEEVESILKACENLKHKTILYAIYAAGLRRSEAINLKIMDIDVHRNLINIRGGKGNKDRVTLLSEKFVALLDKYYAEYKPRLWVFEGDQHKQYSSSSIQKIFIQAVMKTGIKKKVSLHTLRHSFATHLLERGTDIRYIQSFLGHNSSKTTEIYAHVTRKGFEKIKSPLDNLDL